MMSRVRQVLTGLTSRRVELGQDVDVYGLEHSRAYAPHCDPSILHAPGSCRYCDHYPDWQAYRKVSEINFTGEDDPALAPCPSLHFRPAEVRDQWGGNVARPE